jgi:hypothetical protein
MNQMAEQGKLLPARGDADNWQPPRGRCGPPEAAAAASVLSPPGTTPTFGRTLASAGSAFLVVAPPLCLPQSGLSRAEDLSSVCTHPHCWAESAASAVRRGRRREQDGSDADGPDWDWIVEGVVEVLEVAQLAHPRGTLPLSRAMCMSAQGPTGWHPAQETHHPMILTPCTSPP